MVRIALVEDHELLAAALETALVAEGHQVVRPPLGSLGEVAALLAGDPPAVVLLDLDLGKAGNGTELIAPLSAAGSRVIVVSATDDEARVGQCLVLGATGWIPKTASFEELLSTVLSAAEGKPLLGEAERQRLGETWRRHCDETERTHERFSRLTRREAAVLAALMEGQTVERIAKASFVSEATVRSQVRAVLLKLGVNSQLEAVAAAGRAGWGPPENTQ
jgi:two-component system nitrate/nitrite response regulator NarL